VVFSLLQARCPPAPHARERGTRILRATAPSQLALVVESHTRNWNRPHRGRATAARMGPIRGIVLRVARPATWRAGPQVKTMAARASQEHGRGLVGTAAPAAGEKGHCMGKSPLSKIQNRMKRERPPKGKKRGGGGKVRAFGMPSRVVIFRP